MTQNQPGQVPPFPGGQQAPPAPGPKPKRNVIAVAALVTALAGFAFGVMEGAYILGWILLPIAFILSLTALFKDGNKGLAAAGLILSIVGTIASVIAFTGSVARIADEAFGGTTPSVAPAAAPANPVEAPADGASEPAAPATETAAGTRENPHPLGTTVSTDEWSVTVNSWTPAATDAVMGENQFNDEPGEGQEYGLVNYTVTRLGDDASSPTFEVRIDYVSASGNVFNDSAVAPDGMGMEELFTGASATGNDALLVPSGDDGRLRVQIGFFGGEDVFFALS